MTTLANGFSSRIGIAATDSTTAATFSNLECDENDSNVPELEEGIAEQKTEPKALNLAAGLLSSFSRFHSFLSSALEEGSSEKNIQEQYADFFEKRDKKKKEAYSQAVYTGWTLVLIGIFGEMVSAVLWPLSDSIGFHIGYSVYCPFSFISSLFLVVGLCFVMSVPTTEFDIDEANRRNVALGKVCCLFFGAGVFIYACGVATVSPWVSTIMWPVAFYVWSHICLPDRSSKEHTDYWRLLSTKIKAIFVLAPITVYALLYLLAFAPMAVVKFGVSGETYEEWCRLLREKQPVSTIYYATMSTMFLGFNINCVRLLLVNRKKVGDAPDRQILDATKLVYISWVSLLLPVGLLYLGNAIAFGPLGLASEDNAWWSSGLIGIALTVPLVTFLSIGDGIMGSWARRFELNVDQLFDDGSILARLAASSTVLDEKTNVTWIYRRTEDARFKKMAEELPHIVDRRFWLKGTIKNKERVQQREQKGIKLTVEVGMAEDCYVGWGGKYVNRNLVVDYSLSMELCGNDDVFEMDSAKWSASNFDPNSPTVALQEISCGVATVHVFLKNSSKTKADLLKWAINNLRLFHWEEKYNVGNDTEDFFFDLLKKSPRELKTEEEKKFTYSLSVPRIVKDHDSKIDFFVSHSWNDDPEFKVRLLRKFALEFYKENNRYPTLWLDKVCINQSAPNDAIAVLPINIGACKSLLILMSPTYLSRLWCVWELLTLFTFCNKEIALQRLKILPMCEPDELDSLLEQFDSFDWTNAHCFDPNEEFKMRQIMDNIGMERLKNSMKEIKAILHESQLLHKTRTFASTFDFSSKKSSSIVPDANAGAV